MDLKNIIAKLNFNHTSPDESIQGLSLVISNVFACKTNSVFNDFVDFCVTGKRNRTGAHAL